MLRAPVARAGPLMHLLRLLDHSGSNRQRGVPHRQERQMSATLSGELMERVGVAAIMSNLMLWANMTAILVICGASAKFFSCSVSCSLLGCHLS